MGKTNEKQPAAERHRNQCGRCRKVYKALEDICYEFDLPKPLWLEANKKEFMTHDKTRFYHDSFIEDINFDFLEVQVIEEDQSL